MAPNPVVESIEPGGFNKVRLKVEDNVEDATHDAIIEVYNKIFGAFYSILPHITANDIKTATFQTEQLVKVARDLGCVHLVSSHVGNALLQYRQSLYKAILADPPRYLLALVLENDFICTESLIHIVGAYPYWPWPTERSALPEEMKRLIARKSQELDTEALEAERELFLLTITSPTPQNTIRTSILGSSCNSSATL
ncbi:hypothetical protein BU25DRAFT_256535 [Macroventuria anomochaeta]|uniref:Uncharacterized protein n=1 Tax=Macroventuria anomochaeta TaxID=301207 RepID=A0ACB6SB75_9PLEO|nr:uncharacterized protein BU25DRAFT_256535 [Macroventuria anomochaeta]KAF2630352.1 hypothetical protein BU25DRAFT_256535 [Macroventuria anomochaeta]